MKVNIISRKLIKPCTPTPQNLNKYKISLTDELSPAINMNVILFYPPNPKNPSITTSHLEESLSKTLPQFYPLAGRYIKKDLLVDCNDEGAEFAEAEATDIELMIDLKTKSSCPLHDLLSRQIYETEMATDPMLSIQITRFTKCGGLAIGISVSHKIFDASSLATFIEAWSINARKSTIIITPSFDSPSLFPCRNLGNVIERPRTRDPAIVVKSFLFNKEDITNLRSKIRPTKSAGEEKVLLFSRVRLVSALIAKAVIRLDREKNGKTRDCFIVQPVNMRGKTLSRVLTQHSCGNLVIPSVTRCVASAANHDTNNAEIGFEELIHVLGDAIHKTIARMSCLGEDGHNNNDVILDVVAKRKEIVSETSYGLLVTDVSKFRFYEADLGWGKPIWAGIGAMSLQHATLLMSNKEGDGIEAWVPLNRNDVPCFQRCLQTVAHEMESEQDACQ